jgi:hypothetical protein
MTQLVEAVIPFWWRNSTMSCPQKQPVALSTEQRQELETLISVGKPAARAALHARILLKADQGPEGPAWTNAAIALALECSTQMVTRVRARFAAGGLQRAVHRKPAERPSQRKLDGAAEARLIALACGPAPDGREHWTIRLLAARLVELGYFDCLSYETVRQTLKRGTSSPG